MACPRDSSVVTEEVAEWQEKVGRRRSRGMVTPGVSCSVVTALTDRNRVIRLERINKSSVSEITDLAKNRNQSQECGTRMIPMGLF